MEEGTEVLEPLEQKTNYHVDPDRPIYHPFAGEIIEPDSIDQLCQMLLRVKQEIDKLRMFEYDIRSLLWILTTGETKTRHLKTDLYEAKLVQADDRWTQSTLKELAKMDPEQAGVYLRIAQYAVNIREFKKGLATSGNERFTKFMEKLKSARQPATSPPTVSAKWIGPE